MHVVSMRKKFSMSFTVETPKVRGRGVPAGRTHKDKRRMPKCKQRANLRKELSCG